MAGTDPDTVQGQSIDELVEVDEHDNTAHSTDYAADPHDNTSHSTNYLESGSIASDTDTASGDGAATTFTVTHTLGQAPSTVHIQPTSADAAGDFHVSNKDSGGTGDTIELTYAAAPASGSDNLTWDIITVA